MTSKVYRLSQRVLALLLSFIMVVTMTPGTSVLSFAETETHPDSITITVNDEEGLPISEATVLYSIDSVANGPDFITGTLTTDATGAVVIMPATDFVEGDFTISATISKQDYHTDSESIVNAPLLQATQDLPVVLVSSVIPGIELIAASQVYDGQDHVAAIVTGLERDDIVWFKLDDGEWLENIPTIKEPGTYDLTMTVEREGYDLLTKQVTAEITLNTITLQVEEYIGPFDGRFHEALIIEGLLDSDVVYYALNGGDETTAMPVIMNAGDYSVTVRVERYGHEPYNQTFSNIRIVPIPIQGITATAYQGIYDGMNHDAVQVTGYILGDIIEYQLADGDWTRAVPQIKDAGNYVVKVRVTRDNHELTEVEVSPTNAYIAKAEQELAFTKPEYVHDGETTVVFDDILPENNMYDFSAIAEQSLDADVNANPLTYSVTNDSDDGRDIADIATIDPVTGQLTVTSAGIIRVTAQRTGNDNYNLGVVSHVVNITIEAGGLVTFPNATVNYVIGANNGIASEQAGVKTNFDDNGVLSYTIDHPDYGLTVDFGTGIIRVSDYQLLSDTMVSNGGTLEFKVTVNKGEGTKRQWFRKKKIYDADDATYTLKVSFFPTPTPTHTLEGTKGANDWYISDVIAKPADATLFRIANTSNVRDFGATTSFSEQGAFERNLYLRDIATGGITAPIKVSGIKIDTEKPDFSKMRVEYSEPILDTVLSKITFGYYKPSVVITFIAEDETSGIDYFDWTYTKETETSDKNKATETGRIVATTNETDSRAELVLTAKEAEQYRGSISFTATDKASNVSEQVSDNDYVFIVDTISPTRSVVINDPKAVTDDGTMHFDGDVNLTFTINEANFYSEDVVVTVEKDGETPYEVSPSWQAINADEHTGTLTLSGDGDYIVRMTYKDRSTNEMQSYESSILCIDTIAPIIEFIFNEEDQTTTFTITEHNFRVEDLDVIVSAKDITGADVTAKNLAELLLAAEWVQDGDVYTTTIADYVDAIYNLTINYTDIALNPAETLTPAEFIIDKAIPVETAIGYSKSLIDTVIEAVTLGFYNPSVTVTFSARDMTAGVDYFTWDYTKQAEASDINRPTDKEVSTISAIQDQTDKSKFTATIVLPENEAEQIRGYLSVQATDKFGNTGDKVTDDKRIIVVDTIAPTVSVEYNSPNRTVGTRAYYNQAITATFTVKEANFFGEDVIINLSKDGGAAYQVKPEWRNIGEDTYVGIIQLLPQADHATDGDYVVSVAYKDRSNNEMATYTSHVMTLDTINPTASVVYSNTDVKNTLADSEGKMREYYNNTQVATITITEHNFNADEVNISILTKDGYGSDIANTSVLSKSAWTSSGDSHKQVITYYGDANYTFDVDYTDLATNKMADYETDYFTVDKVAPANLSIAYSSSILDTVLEAVSFGFYNAKVIVTISANDVTSKINSFEYSYVNAAGVSGVNAELRGQVIPESSISYSNNGASASASFEIPQAVLTSNNQFNGTVQFIAKDRAGNTSELNDNKRTVVDNISPVATVTYNNPVQTENGIAYYNGTINGTINITEANFYPQDVVVTVSKNGGAATAITPNWSSFSVDFHVGSFSLADDGDYIVTVNYSDKSNNAMAGYVSNQMTIDTDIEAPKVTINGADGNGKAYKDKVVPEIVFNDQNFDRYELTLTQTRFGEKNVDVRSKFIGNRLLITNKGGSGVFDTFDKVRENDGIYNLSLTIYDKAGHKSTTAITFTVNRFGSVYEYNDALNELIKDGGAYVKQVDQDLGIIEYNADKLVKDSLNIEITKDGKPISDVIFTSTPTINSNVTVGSSGWYQYEYTISKDNFALDGIYKITVSSKDQTGNTPENTNFEDQTILFHVDSTPPEITSIVGLEKNIINAQQVEIKYNVYDTIGLAATEIYVNDELVETVSDYSNDLNNYSGSFVVSESSKIQSVQLVVKDLAGNMTDTKSDDFKPSYVFNDDITVSTNALVRWYANKALFGRSIGGVVLLGATLFFLIGKKRKKDKPQPIE